MSDEGFREIQLNGKQLVFLFMAATVVSVVIFLCGVLVGRGVRTTGAGPDALTAAVSPDTAPSTPSDPTPPASSAAPTSGPSAEELSYAERLLRDTPPEEKLQDKPKEKPAPPPPPAATPAASAAPAVQEPMPAQPPSETPATNATAATASDPAGPGYAVQVAAYRDRREADTLARQLIAKGYPAFVMDPVKGAPTALFRVRVGKYKTLKDAEAVSARLQSAEQFNAAWIAR